MAGEKEEGGLLACLGVRGVAGIGLGITYITGSGTYPLQSRGAQISLAVGPSAPLALA